MEGEDDRTEGAATRRPIPTIGQIVLKVAGACNLNCSYCYVYNARDRTYRDRPAQMSEDVLRATLARVRDYCDARPPLRMSICLHGGEPLLLGKERFRRFIDIIRRSLPEQLGSLSIQTNGVLVDRGWAQLLRELRLSVSVSLDGAQAAHDSARVDHSGRGTHAATVSGIRCLLDEGVRLSVLCVVRPGRSGASAYHYFRSLGLTELDFLLPDVSHDDWHDQFAAWGPTPAADYLIPALDAWLAEDNPDVNIRFFGDIFRLILGDSSDTDAFGGGAMPYLVMETDGTIQANDALRVCEQSMGETGLSVLTDDLEQLERSRPLVRRLLAGDVATPDGCRACPELSTCGGGYMPHRYSRERGFNNPSVWCADILRLFEHMRGVVQRCQPEDAGALAR